MNKFRIVVFSKDRACQLDLFLRSFKKFFKEIKDSEVFVIYKYSEIDFKRGYDKLIKKHVEFDYVIESDFRKDVLSAIDGDYEHLIFFVDDNVFKKAFSSKDKEFVTFENDPKIACLSLRMCKILNYSYVQDKQVKIPELDEENRWNWKKVKDVSMWGYPMSLDGHVFKKEDIVPIIKKIEFTKPNNFEHSLSLNPIEKDFMICFDEPKVVNVVANKVQEENENRAGNLDVHYLNKIFLDGKVIDMKKITKLKNKSTHVEMELDFIKE